ncbi:type II toxin-antitoxin system HipA family toxin [Conexibacter arvalis]|uniref:Serine/threonine-protein kinase HipA n=1 Tax=Conexibacter arvalis TaxID=912552 RepID=A0A840IE47_9ACTN|nr:type II toxin-antitoxin system HipA family toxin [Conexibacter arvalis]MBB4662344.1 serine/threonine-protein kinase HipA [Conexibacter arvalis]
MSSLAEVRLWGRAIGAVSLDSPGGTAVFQYDREFAGSGIEVAPLAMPLRTEPYAFPALAHDAFRGLPGLLADSLPDRFGNALIDAWLARQGRAPESFDAVERLCYVGTRGMGALEFAPSRGPAASAERELEVGALVALAAEVLSRREALSGSLDGPAREHALADILRVGTSAGGARAKAVIAWNPESGVVRSGQVHPGDGFEHWLLKFDGVSGSGDKGLEDPLGYGAIEYAYALMARAAGIEMSPCRLLEENGRRHFMTRRFDRLPDGGKLHMQSLGALGHHDYNLAGAHSYEQALQAIRRLGLGMAAIEEQFRRMAFNVVARNQDDHVKNIAFLMDRAGGWRLSPAFDLTYAWEPGHRWVGSHQMTVNGKRDGFEPADLRAVADGAAMARGRAAEIVAEVVAAVTRWPEFAAAADVPEADAARIARGHRLRLGG